MREKVVVIAEPATRIEAEATKSGWWSTEFWMKVIAYVVPLVPIFMSIFRLPEEDTERVTQILTSLITSVGLGVVTIGGAVMYARERTKAKVKMLELVAMREGAAITENPETGERVMAMSMPPNREANV